ncbi:T9SS type A sorting domain-containing protein [Winogradskyella ouciana]|uniref:T9SS type A sorting domain-containing protein n=1 Tax=Winogradskyella ouciana TaxID=2608631 RepID=UPI003D2CE157
MKKITSKKLLKYSALSAAIAGIADVNGQIVYTDIADFTGGGAVDYNLDLNNDSTIDFIVNASSYNSSIFAVFLNSSSLSTNSFLGSQPNYTYPFAMNAGDAISSGQTGWYNIGTLNYVSCYNGTGSSNWCGVSDKFIGLRFDIGGNTHYGWARLDVSASGDSFTVKDYAYNSTPGEAINAGQTTLSINEFENSNTRIVPINKSIGLYNLPASTEYRIIDITGKSVLNGSLETDSYVIEANSLSNGVYIVELNDVNSKAVIRKKIVL